MYAFVKPFSEQKGESFEIYPDGFIACTDSGSTYVTLQNDSHIPCNTVSLMLNVCIRCAIFWTKGESFDNVRYLQFGLSHVIWYLSAGYKKGVKSWCDELRVFYLMLCNDSHTLIWRVILLYNEITPVGSAYLMLKNNVYTTGNTISSIVNTCIRYTIMWAKWQ